MSKFFVDRPGSKEKYLQAFLLGFGCLIISLLPIMIAENGYFIYSGDYNAQQIPFYNLANDAVRSRQFGWNWYTDLGSDLLTSYSFYLMGSPFFWLSTLLPRSLVTYSMPFLLAMKHGLASMTAYAYIRRFVRCKDSALIGGILYAFSGFQVYNIFFNHFQDVTAFFPLMLIAMEENINNHRKGIFAVTVAFMAILNYYFFTGQAVFLIIYYICRMNCPDFKTSWKKFFWLGFEAVAGTMIAAFVLLPSALAIIENYRVKEHLYGQSMVIYNDKTIIPRIIQTFFMPADSPSRPNLFRSDYGKWSSIGGFMPLFSMAGAIAFFKKHKKHWASRLMLICTICAFIPILNSAFYMLNASYYARWYYMPILILAMMTARSLDEDDAPMMYGWKFCAAMLAIFCAISLLPTRPSKTDKVQFFKFPKDFEYFWITAGVTAGCLAVSFFIFRLKKKGKNFRKLSVAAVCIASVGCCFTMVFYAACSVDSAKTYISSVINGKDDVFEHVSSDNFFRLDASEGCDNDVMPWGMPTMRTFQSVVSTSIMDFYDKVDVQRDVASRAEVSHYSLRGLFSVKYYYREKEGNKLYSEIISGVPSSSNTKKKTESDSVNIPEELPGFEYIGANDYYEIYENKAWIPMGFTYDTYVRESVAEKCRPSTREKALLRVLILNDEQAEKYKDIIRESYLYDNIPLNKKTYLEDCEERRNNSASSFKYDSKGFESEITLDEPKLVFFSVPYSDGWSAEVNGKKADVERVSYGFMAVKAESGDNTIVFRYKTPGLAPGLIISGAGLFMLAVYLIFCRLTKKKNADCAPHTHYYDYQSTCRISAAEQYCKNFGNDKK